MSGPDVVTVLSGAVTARREVRTGTDVPRAFVNTFPTVEILFTRIVADLRSGATPLELLLDPALGYPLRYALADPAVDHALVVVTSTQRK